MRSISDIRDMIKSIAMVYPILPIEMVSPEPVCIYPVKDVNLYKNYTEVDRWGHCIERISVGEAISLERVGIASEPFESMYEAESEDFYAGVIEHLGMPCTMSYFDAVNSSNVY